MRIPSVLALILLIACGPSSKGDDDTGDGGPGDCVPPARRCEGSSFQICVDGAWEEQQACADACDTNLGCVLCVPGTGTCNGDMSHACRPDGQGYYDEYCDPLQGSTCNPSSGVCEGPCAQYTLGQSYIGCDYYPTQTSQLVNPSFQFAVAVSNASGEAANVTIEGGALTTPTTFTVAPGEVSVQYLPWVASLKRCMTENFYECGAPESYGALAVDGAYHLRSTRPVTVYQFSPLDYAQPGTGKFSYANDASLLMPTNAWTGNYLVAGWEAWAWSTPMPSVMSITASEDGTSVTVNPRANTTGGDGAPNFTAGTPQTVTLSAGDVLMLMAPSGDLTGSTVSADKPVQVVSGHHCTQLPIGYTACDHLEESVFPTEALSTEYLVTAPMIPAGTARRQILRVTATEPNTTVTLDPAVAGPFTIANAGDFIEVGDSTQDGVTLTDVHVIANHKVQVAHYMLGQDAPPAAGIGDPAMTLAVPTVQYRTSYLFHAPTNYTNNYVNITAPTGAVVMLDGAAVPADAYTPVGTSGFGVARMALANTGNGNHNAESNVQFGITVYGYGQYTSFWYPGGLDLTPIPVE